MVKVIMGKKGTGKTKQMIDLINTAVGTEHGNVVAVTHNSKLNYDIHYSIRLVDTSDYHIPNYDTLRGFLYGLYASNYDITHVFIESLNKLVPTVGNEDVEPFLNWLEAFQKAADGRATKIIIPSEIQGLAGLCASAKSVFDTVEPTPPKK